MYLDPKIATEEQIIAEAKRIGETNGKNDPYPFQSGFYEAWISFLVRERDRLRHELRQANAA